jgi:putative flippase GtrA
VNYYLSILILFRHRARWNSTVEILLFLAILAAIGYFDFASTRFFLSRGIDAWMAKSIATAFGLILNFVGRRFVVFPEPANPDWEPQSHDDRTSAL